MIHQGRNLDTDSEFGKYKKHKVARWIWALSNFSKLSTKNRKRLRKRLARKWLGPFDIRVEDCNFRLYPSENYCDRILFSRNHFPEPDEHKAICDLVKPGMTYVDIGTNIGSYAVFLAQKAKGNLRVIGFEPHPITYKKLICNMKINNLNTNYIFNHGCGTEETELTLWSDGGGNVGQTSLIKAATNSAKVPHNVKIRPLLTVLEEQSIHKIDLMKIDIEGFEDQALYPFFKDAKSSLLPQYLLIEFLHEDLWKYDLFGILEQKGYKVHLKTDNNFLYKLS